MVPAFPHPGQGCPLSGGEVVWTAHFAAGTPVVMRPQLTADGRILATFHLEEVGAPGPVAVARYAPGSGWQPTGVLSTRIGHFGKLEGFRIASNGLGGAVALWGETFEVWDNAWRNFAGYYADGSFTF